MQTATVQTTPIPLDPLSGLPGRAAFDLDLSSKLETAQRSGESISLTVLDLDLFGRVNAGRGREAGDLVLRAFAEATRDSVGTQGTVYRFGGDALAVLWPGLEKEQAFLATESLRRILAEDHGLHASAGIAAYPDDGDKPGDIAPRANEALYRAKVSGRDKVCLAREEKMVTKTSHYTQGQLLGLRRLAEREGIKDAELLREALNDLLRKYNA